jgi:hypothetical protein
MTASLLERALGDGVRVTLFDSGNRLGGKLHTRLFSTAPVPYESGVAECYDYHRLGPDPLWDLVAELGLTPRHSWSSAVVFDGRVLRDEGAVQWCLGPRAWGAFVRFRDGIAARIPPARWAAGWTAVDEMDPWARCTWDDLVAGIDDPVARRFVRILCHSDLATESHLTSALVGARTFLRSVSGYGALYTLDGGMEQLARRLARRLMRTDVHLNTPVCHLSGDGTTGYVVGAGGTDTPAYGPFDAVVFALPYPRLRDVEWRSHALEATVRTHLAPYDRPAHYLRIAALFDRPFWRPVLPGPWLVHEAFGGCCLYDESPIGATSPGVLQWLLAGADAARQSEADDEVLGARAIDTLPAALRLAATRSLRELRVHRWVGSLSAQPGGRPLRSGPSAHQPEPRSHPGVVFVGDYLVDSTLNGVLQSARIAARLVQTLRTAGPRRSEVPAA